jgi:hypothetical protein
LAPRWALYPNPVFAIDFRDSNRDVFLTGRRKVLADEIRPDGQLTMAPVDNDGQLNNGGAPQISKRVESRSDGATGVQDVINKDDSHAIHVDGNIGRPKFRPGTAVNVIAVHPDVENAFRDGFPLYLFEQLNETIRERSTSGPDADDDEIIGPPVAFNDFVGDTAQRPRHVVLAHY